MKNLLLVSTALLFLCLSPPARASYLPSQDLLTSPVLLADYVRWAKNFDAFSENPETAAYRDLINILYDGEIKRAWGNKYLPELQRRLDALRALLCPAAAPPSPLLLCALPAKNQTEMGVAQLVWSLQNPQEILALQQRWNVSIHSVQIQNRPRPFNFLLGSIDQKDSASLSYWNLNQATITWSWITPVLSDIDTYLAGFNNTGDYTSQFALSKDGVVINDWQLRDSAMGMAQHWKFTILVNREMRPKDFVIAAEAFQLQVLFDENKELFESVYVDLLPKTQKNAQAYERFLKEKAAGDYPEEVYQRVAFHLISDLVRVQSGYFALAQTQRTQTSDRQKSLESLLTLQKYSSSWRMFLLEITTLASPVSSHAAILGSTIDGQLARVYSLELLKAILGMEGYEAMDLYPRLAYTLLTDELFNAYYLKEARPDLYEQFLLPDGSLRKITSFSKTEQLQILRSYVKDSIGIVRLVQAFASRVRESDLRDLADIMHKARAINFR